MRLRPRRWRALSNLSRTLVVASLVFAALLLADWSRAPSVQWTVRVERAAIARYQAWISPFLSRGGVRCRFEPSCSHYAAAVLLKDGAVRGNLRIVGRLFRCGPWTRAGSLDPP